MSTECICRDPKNLEPAMLVLTDELMTGQTTGFLTHDFSKEPSDPDFIFWLKVILLILIGDYPGTGKVICMHHSGFRACHWCWHRFDTINTGHSCAVNMRQHLSFSDAYRAHPIFGNEEHAAPPAFRTHAECVELAKKVQGLRDEGAAKATFLANEMKRCGIMGLTWLMILAFFDVVWDVMPCTMHINKGLWQKWVIPMMKGTLIERNKQPKKPATRHMEKGKEVAYTPSEMLLRNTTWESNMKLWEAVHTVH